MVDHRACQYQDMADHSTQATQLRALGGMLDHGTRMAGLREWRSALSHPAVPAGVVQAKFYEPGGALEMMASQANTVAARFRTSSHYLALQRQNGFTPAQIDAALEELGTGDKYRISVNRNDSGAIDDHATFQDIERVLWQAITDMTRGDQIFGCDIHDKAKVAEADQIDIFARALAAGYRKFDAAEAYGTTPQLMQAITASGIPASQITIIYKSRPVEVGDAQAAALPDPGLPQSERQKRVFAGRIDAGMRTLPGDASKILMLHDLDVNMDVNKRSLDALYEQAGGGGNVIALGVSNVDLLQLTELHAYLASKRSMRIEFVENRNSPYIKDGDVRKFCSAHAIRYVGFGEFGSRGGGDCEEGEAFPQNNLLPLQDPRVKALAAKTGVDAGKMLLAWANQRGVDTVTHSRSDPNRNQDASKLTLDNGVLAQLDAMFQSGEELDASAYSATAGVSMVHQALKDGMLWFILDTLLADRLIKGLFQRVVADTCMRYPPPPQAQGARVALPAEAPLRTFGYNLLRLAARIQAQLALEGSSGHVSWLELMVDTFHTLAVTLGADGAVGRLYRWTQGDYMETGGAALAVTKLANTAAPVRKYTYSVTQLNTAMTHRTRHNTRVREEIPDNFVETFAAQDVRIGDIFSSDYEPGVDWNVTGVTLVGGAKIDVEER